MSSRFYILLILFVIKHNIKTDIECEYVRMYVGMCLSVFSALSLTLSLSDCDNNNNNNNCFLSGKRCFKIYINIKIKEMKIMRNNNNNNNNDDDNDDCGDDGGDIISTNKL